MSQSNCSDLGIHDSLNETIIVRLIDKDNKYRVCRLTLLLLFPTVVSEIGDIIFFYTSLHILQIIPRIFFIETISHIERHLQV